MITPAPSSSETFGLPAEASHLIAKLRNLNSADPQLLAMILREGHK